jgi:hypothetical protein
LEGYKVNSFLILVAVIAPLVIAYQIYISRRIARAPDYTDQQRRLQLIMIWCLPVVGSVVCHLMLSESAEVTAEDGIDSAGHDERDGGHDGGGGDGGAGD